MTATAGIRYRIVRAQDGLEHVDPLVLTEDEAHQHLDLEAHLMEAHFWSVERVTVGDNLVAVRAITPTGSLRYLFARSFDPMEDER